MNPLSQIPSKKKDPNQATRNLDQIMNFEQEEFLAQVTIDNFLAPDAPVSIEVPKLIPNRDTMLTHPTHNQLTSARNHQIHRVNQFTRCFRPNHQLSECFAFNDAYHRPVAGPSPCLKSMAGNNELQNSNTFPLDAIDRTVNVLSLSQDKNMCSLSAMGILKWSNWAQQIHNRTDIK